MITEHGIQYRYLRIQGRKIVKNTGMPMGFFTMIEQLKRSGTMLEEDRELIQDIDDWFAEALPFPPQCQNGEKVVCYFKSENNELLKYVNPLLWALDLYQQPYEIVYTNFPGEIVYEDDYQIAVRVPERVVESVIKEVTGK